MQLISPLLKIQNQLRIFHWQTQSYSQHKAFGKAYEDLDPLIDNFVEVFSGKYGITRAKLTYQIELVNFSEDHEVVIHDFTNYLFSLSEDLDPSDTDLLNIRDEMLAVLHKLKYLLSLA